MADLTDAQVRGAALLARMWYAADCAGINDNAEPYEGATRALDTLGINYPTPDTARAYMEAAQRELAAMEEGGVNGNG